MTSETENQDTEDQKTDDVENLFEGTEESEEKTEETEDTKGETETEDKTEETEESAPPAEEEKLVPKAALHDERRRRQQAEEEAEKLRKLLPETDEAPDPYEDIDAYNDYMRCKWEKEQKVKQDEITRERLEKSRSKMLETATDYENMEKIFGLMVADDPTLADKMLASGDEAKFVYDTAKKYKEELLKPETKSEEKPEPSHIDGANLATATAQKSNTDKVEKEESLDEMFDDQIY